MPVEIPQFKFNQGVTDIVDYMNNVRGVVNVLNAGGSSAGSQVSFDALVGRGRVQGVITTAGAGLTVAVSSGNAFVGGAIEVTAKPSVSVVASATNYIYLVSDDTITVNQTGVVPAGVESILIATAATSASAVTSVDLEPSGWSELELLGTLGSGDGITDALLAAILVRITDAGGYYTSNNVEGALQEAGAVLATAATLPVALASTTAADAGGHFTGATGEAVTQELGARFGATGEPCGFPDQTSATLSFADATRTFTITPVSGSFTYWQNSTLYTVSAADSVVITDVQGEHYIYYDGATLVATANPTHSQLEDVIKTNALVSYIYWDAVNSEAVWVGEERHGYRMSGGAHYYLHTTTGARHHGGSALGTFSVDGSGALAEHAQFGVALGAILDEDIEVDLAAVASTVGLTVFSRSGAAGDWIATTNAGYPMLTTGTGRLAWNELTGGSWQQTEATNNDFVLCHVFASTNALYPYVVVQGQAQYTTLGNARAGALVEIESLNTEGLPGHEMLPIGTVIFQTSNGYSNAVKAKVRSDGTGANYVDWRFSDLGPASTPSSHSSLSDLTADDHAQYALLAGRTGGQTLSGSDTTAEDLTLQDNSADANTVTVTQLIPAKSHSFGLQAGEAGTSLATGLGQAYTLPMSASLNGMNVVSAVATVAVAGATGTMTLSVRRQRGAAFVDLFSTDITIDSAEYSSETAATAAIINVANYDIATGDLWILDIDGVHTTPAQLVGVTLTAELP